MPHEMINSLMGNLKVTSEMFHLQKERNVFQDHTVDEKYILPDEASTTTARQNRFGRKFNAFNAIRKES